MAELHDGDSFLIRGGENPLFAEFLDTNGRMAFRLTDKHGSGILLEKDCIATLSVLLDTALDKPAPDFLEYMKYRST